MRFILDQWYFPGSPEEALSPFIVQNTGWSFVKDHGKLGLVPEGVNSTMILEFHSTTHPIHSVTVLTMKSYGDRQADSYVRVQTFELQRNLEMKSIASIDILGFHDSEMSVSYKYSIPGVNITHDNSLFLQWSLLESQLQKSWG